MTLDGGKWHAAFYLTRIKNMKLQVLCSSIFGRKATECIGNKKHNQQKGFSQNSSVRFVCFVLLRWLHLPPSESGASGSDGGFPGRSEFFTGWCDETLGSGWLVQKCLQLAKLDHMRQKIQKQKCQGGKVNLFESDCITHRTEVMSNTEFLGFFFTWMILLGPVPSSKRFK